MGGARQRTVWIPVAFVLLLCCAAVYLCSQYLPNADSTPTRTAADAPAEIDPLGMLLIDVDTRERAEDFSVEAYGVYVLAVAEDSAAQRAGLQTGDRITALDGAAIGSTAELYERLSQAPANAPVRLSGLRDGRERAWQLTPAQGD